nr:carbohydrate ABC transporter permease [Clostridia bacterium]
MVKRKTLTSVFAIVLFVILILYTISLLFPIIWTFLVSLKSDDEFIFSLDADIEVFLGWPREGWAFSNYSAVFKYFKIETSSGDVYLPEMFFNGFSYAIVSALITIFTNCVVAYVVAKYKCVLTSAIYTIVIVFMILPVIGTLPAELEIMNNLGFYDNMIGIFLMKIMFGGTNFLIFYAMFKSVSWSYAEAAFVDGASHFRVFFQIMLPMAVPTFFALVLMQFITLWNDWQASLIYFPSHPTIAYGLYRYANSTGNEICVPYVMVACMMVALPIIVLFLAFRNKIVGTIAVGGLKG